MHLAFLGPRVRAQMRLGQQQDCGRPVGLKLVHQAPKNSQARCGGYSIKQSRNELRVTNWYVSCHIVEIYYEVCHFLTPK